MKKFYQPINYRNWDLNGEGKNLVGKLNQIETKIWQKALPYQDKRKDTGHGKVVTYFALELLRHIKAEREIVVPATILHDIGWSQLADVEIALFYEIKNDGLGNQIWRRYESVLRARHQERGLF